MDPTLETIETFEIPVELTSIVFFFTNIHNIRKAFCGLHVLFTRKTRFIYEHFLNWLVVMYNINNIQWQHVMMDHEEAMISALNCLLYKFIYVIFMWRDLLIGLATSGASCSSCLRKPLLCMEY